MATNCIPSNTKKKSFNLMASGSPVSSKKAIVRLGVSIKRLVIFIMTAAMESVFPSCDARMAKNPDSPIKSVPKMGIKMLTTDKTRATIPRAFIKDLFCFNLAYYIFISNFI